MSGFNPNAGSFNPNAGSFQPSGGAPPFQPGRQYTPYGQQQQGGQQQPGANPADYYNQYNAGGYGGGYGNYGGFPQQGGYPGQQMPQGYGANDPFAQQQYNQNPYNAPPPRQQQQQQAPPARNPAPSASSPFTRTLPDSNAPPAKAVSLSIGGKSVSLPSSTAPKSDKPASVSLSIGGGGPKASSSSKTTTPGSSKPATPALGATSSAASSTPAAAKKGDAQLNAAEKKIEQMDKKQEKIEQKIKKDEAKRQEKVEKEEKDADKIEEEVKASVDEETLLDLYGNDTKDIKPHMNIVFIGHVDAGKSTMGGNILYLCGMVDKRTLEKYEKEAKEAGRESWYLSWALDSTSQEREKGKTVEVGRAYFETDTRRYTILDAPGHKTYVPQMISGAAQADAAVLVISARKGEFETGFEKGGQTREHAMLVKTAGVNKLIVVINKMDDPTVNWDKARYDEIVGKLTPFLKGSGYNMKTDVAFIPISGFTGANLKVDVDRSVAPWVEGESLLNYLDHLPLIDRKNNAPLMMPISEKYADMGCVVVGKVESGHVKKGQNLLLMPNKTPVSVTAVLNEVEEEIPVALCGDNVRLRLRGVEDTDINVGFVLTSPKAPVHTITQFEAQLVILDHKNIITAGYGAVMHVHTAAEEVSLSALLHYFDKKTGKKSRRPPQFAKKGQKIIALIEAAGPLCVEKFADHPQLGRFTLRDEGKTVAIGKITKLIEREDDLPDVAKLDVAA
ncbi:translation termination factor GTPase eRF3 [Sporobolomyces salmoneus]|uniref:translation termination factor GTPase eRF3 n=1 Tax=Sporobolomyces salmoneus TaxID=183962 RepID=UPI00317A1F96